MWQHRYSLWSGFLGASASCLIKMGITSTDIIISDTSSSSSSSSSSPIQLLEYYTCQQSSSSKIIQHIDNIDEIILKQIYKILGDLMIKHRINLMIYVIPLQEYIQGILLKLHIIEIDYCQLLIILPIRLLCIIGMIVLNAYMIGSFLKGMKESGTVIGTTLSTASNFFCSAIYGVMIWNEQINTKWCIGFTCVMLGVIMLSNVQAVDNEQDKVENKETTKQRQTKNIMIKSSSIQKTSPPRLTKGNVAALRSKFTDNNNKNNYNDTVLQIKTITPVVGPRKKKIQTNSFVAVTPSPSSKQNSEGAFLGDKPSSSTTTTTTKPSSLKSPKNLKAEQDLIQYYPDSGYKQNDLFIDRSFLNECVLCEEIIFDKTTTGESLDDRMVVADLSPNTCYHIFHATCLKKSCKSFDNACPICQKPLSMWVTATQAAPFPGFWLHRVERFLQSMDGPPSDPSTGEPMCLSATMVREYLSQHKSLTTTQKQYIYDDPTGKGKGLQAALEWGGYKDYNTVPKGHIGFVDCLRTKGLWKYDPRKDDIWLWEWGPIHPRKRCDQCQLMNRPLPVPCDGCQGSAEAALYCTESCCKRDWQRHRQTCQKWKDLGPPSKKK
jgi:hypothetical protein